MNENNEEIQKLISENQQNIMNEDIRGKDNKPKNFDFEKRHKIDKSIEKKKKNKKENLQFIELILFVIIISIVIVLGLKFIDGNKTTKNVNSLSTNIENKITGNSQTIDNVTLTIKNIDTDGDTIFLDYSLTNDDGTEIQPFLTRISILSDNNKLKVLSEENNLNSKILKSKNTMEGTITFINSNPSANNKYTLTIPFLGGKESQEFSLDFSL